MTVRIALFRGINVGGRNRLPMKELKSIFECAGCSDVKSYIQSGNIVFTRAGTDDGALSRTLCAAIEAQFGFSPTVLLLPATALQAALAANPFPGAESKPQSLHLWFMEDLPADADCDRMLALKTANEAFALRGRVLYLHAPDGVGRSKLAQRIEHLLGVPATARNWRTATRILALADIGPP